MNSHFQRLLGPNNFSIGLELPLDNDWSTAGQRLRMAEKRPFGVPDLKQHAQLAALPKSYTSLNGEYVTNSSQSQ
ncbi:hypothetical protein [Pseudomonas sp. LB1P83]